MRISRLGNTNDVYTSDSDKTEGNTSEATIDEGNAKKNKTHIRITR